MEYVYDKKKIAEKLLMSEEECMEIFLLYINEYEEKRKDFFQLSKMQKIESLIRLAHSFKGSSYSLQLKPIGDIFYQIELDARKNNIDNLEDYIDIIDKLINDFKKQIS